LCSSSDFKEGVKSGRMRYVGHGRDCLGSLHVPEKLLLLVKLNLQIEWNSVEWIQLVQVLMHIKTNEFLDQQSN
jgi:hypothetical protein